MMNKNKICLFPLFLLALGISAQNPIPPMGVYLADPAAHVMPDGKLYVYGSNDEARDHYCSSIHHLLSTDDMKNWTVTKNIFVSKGPKSNVTYVNEDLYAPDCVERNGKYYLYYCQSDFNEGVAVGKSPKGPFGKGTKIP